MDIVLLCAGTSSRMGKTNKLLLPVNKTTIVANSALQALKFLETRDESSTLIVVTGYQRYSIEKALRECKDYVAASAQRISMVVVYNPNYRDGQFTSVQTGVKQVKDNSDFYICLADLPQISPELYASLSLDSSDACRPFFNGTPGHPVLLSKNLKEKILRARKNNKVSNILQSCVVKRTEVSDASCIHDIDTLEDAKCLK